MRWECRERFPRHRLQRKPLSDPGMHHGTCVTYVPWWMSGSLTRGGGENVHGIPGACATRNFTYLVRGPWSFLYFSVATTHSILVIIRHSVIALKLLHGLMKGCAWVSETSFQLKRNMLCKHFQCRFLDHLMTSSNGNILRVTGPLWGEFPSQRPVTWSFEIFFDLRLNKRLSKPSRDWCFETPSRSLWRHCNESRDSWRLRSLYCQEFIGLLLIV